MDTSRGKVTALGPTQTGTQEQRSQHKGMAFLRSVATTTTAIAAFAFSSLYSSQSSQFPKTQNLSFLCSTPNPSPTRFGLVKNFANPPSALHMDAPTSDHKPTSQVRFSLQPISSFASILMGFYQIFNLAEFFNRRAMLSCQSYWLVLYFNYPNYHFCLSPILVLLFVNLLGLH